MKRQHFGLLLLMVVLASLLVFAVPTFASAPVCNPGDAGYNARNDRTGMLLPAAFNSGQVTNKSLACAYKIGIASYKKYHATDISSQELFDHIKLLGRTCSTSPCRSVPHRLICSLVM
jgi:hypothetical protein